MSFLSIFTFFFYFANLVNMMGYFSEAVFLLGRPASASMYGPFFFLIFSNKCICERFRSRWEFEPLVACTKPTSWGLQSHFIIFEREVEDGVSTGI